MFWLYFCISLYQVVFIVMCVHCTINTLPATIFCLCIFPFLVFHFTINTLPATIMLSSLSNKEIFFHLICGWLTARGNWLFNSLWNWPITYFSLKYAMTLFAKIESNLILYCSENDLICDWLGTLMTNVIISWSYAWFGVACWFYFEVTYDELMFLL